MKNDLPFFSHDNNASLHPKMSALIQEYGYEGYGRFWALNENIARSEGAFIDISRKIYKSNLASTLKMKTDELDVFLTYLSDPEIDLINIQDNKITTDRINELYKEVMENRETERVKKQHKKGKQEIPEGKDNFPEGKQEIPEGKDNKEKKNKEEEIKENINSTAVTVPPKNISKKTDLSQEQLILYHAAKACFDNDEGSKAIIYQDKQSTSRELKHIKTIAVRCNNIVPDLSADFLRNILEQFKVMCNGKYKDKWTFNPQCLITPWIWGLVLDSLPKSESQDLINAKESMRGIFSDT